jgi:hypothetical protein
MTDFNPLKNQKSEKIPVDSTFIWRNDTWLSQGESEQTCRIVPKGVAVLLKRLKAGGQLVEVAPGLFKLSGTVSKPLVNEGESPLFRLACAQKSDGTAVLDAEQFNAGEKLRRDYEFAHLRARVTMNYDNQTSEIRDARFSDNHIAKLSDDALAARDRVHAALEAVGPELSGILMQVCCLTAGLEQAELALNLPRRAGRAILSMALARLARHYGLKPSMRHAGPAQIGHWAVVGFKPKFPSQHGHQL